jgi:MinD-like ATPase involved in chromosome partitioning or flagellar assembly
VLFGFAEDNLPAHTLNEHLQGDAPIESVAIEVTERIPGDVDGAVFLVASSIRAADISAVLRNGYDVERLNDALVELGRALGLDVVLVDTHPGLNEETLLTTAICDVLVVLLRPDHQDYQGTAVTVDVAGKLGVPEQLLVVNKVYADLAPDAVASSVSESYGLPVAAVLPLSDEVAANASAGLFSLASPGHPWSAGVVALADRLTSRACA